ncbi:SCO4225 family membrane protein [Streptomyces sp. NPDC006527]|uniref:SCO4225 family membrane protein n=1 Tax=Streptomyces sp. NPDC006527 TaxID=3364749 RepID=UPI0036A50D81
MSIAATSRSLFRTTTGNRASRIYLAVVAAALVWAHVDAAFVAQADSSFVGIYSVAVTAPISVALLLVGAFEALPFTLLIVVCALVNAHLIGLAVRRIAAHR